MGEEKEDSIPRLTSTFLPVDKAHAWFDGATQQNGTLWS
jgi:hypothetical protein